MTLPIPGTLRSKRAFAHHAGERRIACSRTTSSSPNCLRSQRTWKIAALRWTEYCCRLFGERLLNCSPETRTSRSSSMPRDLNMSTMLGSHSCSTSYGESGRWRRRSRSGVCPHLRQSGPAYDPRDFEQAPPTHSETGIFEHLGRATAEQIDHAGDMLGFLGDCLTAFVVGVRRRGLIRWGEVLDVATEAGANAVPIVLLVGFLMGVIIAFEIGLVARQFGAVIFVVNGVGVAMLRELGPLMTAIVFAGRTGAAFAAQIGTQKVNEEVNAISTFGLSPVQFMVLPRLLAAAFVVPLLAVLADLVGLFGGALVMATFDVGFLQFYTQLLGAITASDFLIGIVKAIVFGLTIAAIGCQRGLATGAGATSVGLSTTSTVVTSIVMIVVIDGIFTVITS